MTPKGVKAYEAFLLARQFMNRTVYYHHNVKGLECMMEHVLRLVIHHLEDLLDDVSLKAVIPPYLRRVAAFIRQGVDQDVPNAETSKEKLMKGGYQDDVRLTEDAIWSLVAAVVDSRTVPMLQSLAHQLLARQIPWHAVVQAETTELRRRRLYDSGFTDTNVSTYPDFHLVDLKTTTYKSDDDEGVFVAHRNGDIRDVREHSDIISAFGDQPKVESLPIVVDPITEPAIRDLGEKTQCMVAR
jgi:HD superfamily phosphohydrolase